MNTAVRARINREQHRFVVEQGLRPRLTVARSRPLVLSAEELPWARAYADGLVAELRRRGVTVVGDLRDLVPGWPDREGAPHLDPFDDVRPAELLEATEAALAALAEGHARLFRRFRQEFRAREGRLPAPSEVMGSALRAAMFGLQKAALRRSGRSRLLARAARAYVNRTAGHR
jgi:hypothetical protein